MQSQNSTLTLTGYMEYRKEIDGLRAIAVVPVVLYHAEISLFGGGFVGVDVFFVISGYLITSQILLHKHANNFSILEFYERRARRILPALFLVCVACIPFAWLLMMPNQLEEFSRSLISVVFFSSNVFFWKNSSYFDVSAEEKPLLHTWSLSIEEQFYILFPIFLAVLWRFEKKVIVATISVSILISLGLTEWGWRSAPNGNFYLLPTRAWELLAGALIAFYMFGQDQKGHNEVLPMLGILLIAFAVFVFDSGTPFPSLYALIPVAGTSLILIFANNQTLLGKILSNRALVGIGLISYSLYLWHQPLLVFARLGISETLANWHVAVILCLAIALSYLSWRFVEKPLRKTRRVNRKGVFALSATAGMLLIGSGAYLWLGGPVQDLESRLGILPRDQIREMVWHRHDKLAKSFSDDQSTKKLLIIGDSYSADFVNMAAENSAFQGYEIVAVYVPSSCQTYLGDKDVSQFRDGLAGERRCQRAYDRDQIVSLSAQTDVVVLISRWKAWAAERISETVASVSSPGNRVFVLGRKHITFPGRRQSIEKKIAEQVTPATVVQVNMDMKQRLENEGVFIDIQQFFCGENYPSCSLFTDDKSMIPLDKDGHMSLKGARYLGGLLFTQTELKEFM